MDALHLALSIEWDDCTVALGGAGLDCLEWRARDMHAGSTGAQASRDALSLIDHALQQVGRPLSAVSCFHVNRGPGAFTALRIAIGLVQGLALPRQRPVSGIDSLASLASTVPAWHGVAVGSPPTRINEPDAPAGTAQDWLLCSALDARMGECYYAVYHCQAGAWPTPLLPARVGSPEAARDAFVEQILAAGRDAAGRTRALNLAGGAFRDFPPLHDWAVAQGHQPAEVALRRPSAAAILRVATAIGAPLPGPARETQPLYVRDRVALDRDEQRQAAALREARRLQTAPPAGAAFTGGHGQHG
ncbi:MAG: tRNA (adenosine(37)-N6)-threonylcarbamoyltransferase complex dimerization subunit type 1 TsaB [Lautropia sp.]|nr:tRNA (adenosine(37)-N6)-threonylcarbamoyltransferase complex dimerization subunit type 1 TsaB [Lautropia sp.]